MKTSVFVLWVSFCCWFLCSGNAYAQHEREGTRTLHYRPTAEGSFVLVKGKRRFNRALYGTHTAFRVEAGDLPEFAMYMPGMGGNLSFYIDDGHVKKLLTDADSIVAVYDPGRMRYTVRDKVFANGDLQLEILALAKEDGLVLKWKTDRLPSGVKMFAVFGGASGKTFSRNGDIGADPEASFYRTDSNCLGNRYTPGGNAFLLGYGHSKKGYTSGKLYGISSVAAWRLSDNRSIRNRKYVAADTLKFPVVTTCLNDGRAEGYLLIKNAGSENTAIQNVPAQFDTAVLAADRLRNRISVRTPDPFINCLGGALGMAADAIWESPVYMHGAIAWRMPLNGWRGAYAADAMGWHDRAETYFNAYALSQLDTPSPGVMMPDTALNLARQKEVLGDAVYSAGYIARYPNGKKSLNHYDMNLVFIDQLLTHFDYTGDTAYVRKMWPLIKLHLAWEKRNFDVDNDGLYDAYACIWASDALQYSGGDVTHSSAYNYRANKEAARLATIIGEDATLYEKEAAKIWKAVNGKLWLQNRGHYAEYKDVYGAKNIHPAAGLWTIYHAMESGLPDKFQAYQALKYVDKNIPHIPIRIKTCPNDHLYLLSTTDWQPYTWSVNNVALAENLHTALAYWQGGRVNEAYTLWRSALIESMFLSAAPGNFEQLSSYDAMRGELYRDFADPIGMAARSLTEGLFGLHPDALSGELYVRPGLPLDWDSASLKTPDIDFNFQRRGLTDLYDIDQHYPRRMSLKLDIPLMHDGVEAVFVNNRKVAYKLLPGLPYPLLEIIVPANDRWYVKIINGNHAIIHPEYQRSAPAPGSIKIDLKTCRLLELKDPQSMLAAYHESHNELSVLFDSATGKKYGTFFIHLQQGMADWWQPVDVDFIQNPIAKIPAIASGKCLPVDMSKYFNDKVTHIFRKQYYSPRPDVPTLQLPVQGVGNWCYPKVMPDIDEKGLINAVKKNNGILNIGDSIKFALPTDTAFNDILFTSLWDCYPHKASVPLQGKARSIALLVTGTTDPMQSQMQNGLVSVQYTDGSSTDFALNNPETWWPIEQDYFENGLAFHLNRPPPIRVHLKTGKVYKGFAPQKDYVSIKGFSDRCIDGGAATVLLFAVDASKRLKSLTIKTTANDVVVGLMAISLIQ